MPEVLVARLGRGRARRRRGRLGGPARVVLFVGRRLQEDVRVVLGDRREDRRALRGWWRGQRLGDGPDLGLGFDFQERELRLRVGCGAEGDGLGVPLLVLGGDAVLGPRGRGVLGRLVREPRLQGL